MSNVTIFLLILDGGPSNLFCLNKFSFIRDLFRIISKCVGETKFADGEPETPFVISFMFFRYICPVLVNPMKYGAVEEISPNQLATLLSCSKLLNDVALNNWEKYDKLSGSWILENFKKLCDCINLFIDEEEIQKAQIIIESSTHEEKHPRTEKLLWRKQLYQQFMSWGFAEDTSILKQTHSTNSVSSFGSSHSVTVDSSQSEGTPEIVTKLLEKMNSSKWILKGEKKQVKVSLILCNLLKSK